MVDFQRSTEINYKVQLKIKTTELQILYISNHWDCLSIEY